MVRAWLNVPGGRGKAVLPRTVIPRMPCADERAPFHTLLPRIARLVFLPRTGSCQLCQGVVCRFESGGHAARRAGQGHGGDQSSSSLRSLRVCNQRREQHALQIRRGVQSESSERCKEKAAHVGCRGVRFRHPMGFPFYGGRF